MQATISQPKVIRAQDGPQTEFLQSGADIVIYGGAAGSGKTFGLLLQPLLYIREPKFGAVIIRRELRRVTQEGGMWQEALGLYSEIASSRMSPHYQFAFDSGARVSFGHLETESSKFAWQGAQIGQLLIDQVEELSSTQFWFMQSRCRSTSGIRPHTRCTCNPVPPGHWLNELIDWWWDDDTGYPLSDRSGVLRYFFRFGSAMQWFDSRAAAVEQAVIELGEEDAKFAVQSLTFIAADLDDNPALTEKDPAYRSKLMGLTRVERERLLRGNWRISVAAGEVLNRHDFQRIEKSPVNGEAPRVRYWDRAATAQGDWTVGLLMAESETQGWVIENIVRGRWTIGKRDARILATAQNDGKEVAVYLEQEPGASGIAEVQGLIKMLAGFDVHADRVTGHKLTRALPFAAQVEAGNVSVVRASWMRTFLDEAHNFTGDGTTHDDQVDAASGAFNALANLSTPWIS